MEANSVAFKDFVRAFQEAEHQRYLERERRLVTHFEAIIAKTRAEGRQEITHLREELDHMRSMLLHSMQGGFPPLHSYPTPPADTTGQPFQSITPGAPVSSPISHQSAFGQSEPQFFLMFFPQSDIPFQSMKTIFPCHILRNTIV